VIFLSPDQVCFGRILAMYQKLSGRHSYVEGTVNSIDSLSYISLEIFVNIHNNYFVNDCQAGGVLFAHVAPKSLVYYVGITNEIEVLDTSAIKIGDALFTIYNFFSGNKQMLSQVMK